CRKAGLGIVLVPTVINSVNDHEVGDILKFGLKNIDIIRGVNFQPVSLVDRMPREERERYRITIPDVIKRIEEQTDGEIRTEDFFPVPTAMAISDFVESLAKRPMYDILSRLERRGWVEVQSGRPARYKAKPPAEVIRLLRIEQEQRLKETGEEIVKELEPLYEQKAEARRPDIWVIRGDRNLGGKVGEMLARARVEVLVSLPVLPREFLEPSAISPLLAAKNLTLRVITSEKGKHINELKAIPNLEVRFRKPLFGGGVIVDG
ncbi:unnamed protein product, partial [marine sediment metagenome]